MSTPATELNTFVCFTHISELTLHCLQHQIIALELPSPDKEVKSHSLDSVNEEGISDDSLGDQSSSEPQRKLSPSLFKRRRAADQFRLSSVIKLDYDLSDPIYTRIKDLILKHVLMWVLPSNIQQRGGGISGSPAPSPLLPRRPKFVPSGIELIRDMWFTSRDNVSMLLEICRQGFQTPLLQTYILRKLIELYFHWEQVRGRQQSLLCRRYYGFKHLATCVSLSSFSLPSLPFSDLLSLSLSLLPDFQKATVYATASST